MHLRAKLLGLLIPCVSAPLLAVAWLGFDQLRDSHELQARASARAVLEQVATRAASYRDAVEADVNLFARAPRVRGYLLVEDERDRYGLYLEGLLEVLATFQQARPEYYEIRLLLPDGYEDVRATPGPLANATDDEAGTALFAALRAAGDRPVSMLAVNPDNHEPALYVGRSVVIADTARSGSSAPEVLRGYLVVTSGLSFLPDLYGDDGGRMAIIYTDGRGNPWRDAAAGQVYPGPAVLGAAMASPGETVRANVSGATHLLTGRKLGPDLDAFVAVPTAGLDAAAGRLATLVALVTLVAIAMTAALLYRALAGLLLEPLRRLGAAASALGRGETVGEIGIRSRDEIGDLATRFEQMSENLRRSGERVRFLADHDTLTGLPNRRRILEQVAHALAAARRTSKTVGLLFIDLDNFKQVNDTLGHQAGDELLVAVAERMLGAVRGGDWVGGGATWCDGDDDDQAVGRLGGDEFIVLLTEIDQPEHAATVAQRLIETISTPFELQGNEFHVGASIGVTTFPRDGVTVGDLVRNGDVAMYHAKSRGKHNFQFFDASMNEAAVERLSTEKALRLALANDELVLYYQPQFEVGTGRIAAFEALVRWQHPARGLLLPGAFIRIAEETGLIETLGAWVLREACNQARRFNEVGADPVRVCVNVSHSQFKRPDFQSMVESTIDECGIDPRLVELELTESSVMDSEERSAAILSRLKALGISVSMDDFGTGYSSLAALRRLPLDTLKIDRRFVRDIVDDADAAAIVAAVLSMGRTLGLQIVAEGVEQADQLEWLRVARCDMVQGFLLGRPVPAADAERLLDGGGGQRALATG